MVRSYEYVLTGHGILTVKMFRGLDLARHTLQTFVLHISIVKPLGESGKLQLTTDMTELEFALNTLLAEGVAQGSTKQRWKLDVLGADYKALRAMRSA